MYHILEITQGQPIILWQSGCNLQKYVINSGRIINTGTLLKDINQNFQIWNTAASYISYQSVDGSTVICNITNSDITEMFTVKSKSAILKYNAQLYVFYLEPNEDKFNLCVTNSNDFNNKTIILDDIDYTDCLKVFRYKDYFALLTDTRQLFISSELEYISSIDMLSPKDSATDNLQNEVSKLKFELHQLEQHHSEFVKEYEELATYTGELQEKLRQTRLNIKIN